MDLSTAANGARPSWSFSAMKKSARYSSEHASGFSGPAAAHLAASFALSRTGMSDRLHGRKRHSLLER